MLAIAPAANPVATQQGAPTETPAVTTASPGRAPSDPAAPGAHLQIQGFTDSYRTIIVRPGGKRNPPWTARITKVLVEEGDRVEAGQVIVELDRTEEELEATLRKALADNTLELRNAIEKERLLANILSSAKKLYEGTRSISREDLDKRELEYRLAVADRLRLETAKQRERFEAELAAEVLTRRTIRSPIQGTVVKIFLKKGDSCDSSDALVQIVDTSRGFLVVNVEERIGRTLARGQSANVKIQTGSTHAELTGNIVFVAPIVDPASGMLTVKVEFQNADGKIRPGVPGMLLLGPSSN